MSVDANFDELIKFAKKLNATEDDLNYFLRGFLLNMANRVLARVKPRTPVDTGALRSHWEIGNIVREEDNIVGVEILNDMEYATDIEYGHRIVRDGVEIGWYEGRFMLKISIEEIQRQMPLRFHKEFHNFLKRLGIG